MTSCNDLMQFDFFRFFSEPDCEKLSSIAEEMVVEAGTQMYKKGDPASHIYLIKEGKIILKMESYMGMNKPPLEVTVDIITGGDAMGWSAVVEPYIYTLGALVIDNSSIIALKAQELRELMNSDCMLGYKIMQQTTKLIAHRLDHTRIILVGERGLSHLSEY
jgi:CRP/FNR family transcriptional regulator, cyclic AMP receptor protein